MNHEFPDVQAGFRKGRGTRDQIATIHWIIEKARVFQKNIYFFFIDYTKAFDCVDHNKLFMENLRKIFERWGYQTTWPASWETFMQVKKQQLELDIEPQTVSKSGKKYINAVLSSCLFTLYAEYIMWNPGLDKAQAGVKIAGRNINNLRYADDTTLMAESEEGLKSFLINVKEESEKVGLKLNIQKTKIMASGPINFMGNRWRNNRNCDQLYFGGSQITADGTSAIKLRHLLLGRRAMLWQT